MHDFIEPPRKSYKGKASFVWKSITTHNYLEHFELIKSCLNENLTIKVSDSLQATLDRCKQDDIILLSGEEHCIQSIGNLKLGGSIKGI